jgi:hypothetical protein
MFSLFNFFKSTKKNTSIEMDSALSFIAVASREYGKKYDYMPLVKGLLDDKFKDNPIFFNLYVGNKIFDDETLAIKAACRRGVTNDSAYVIGLKCKVNEIENLISEGKFSSAIVKVINASTKESIDFKPITTTVVFK